jgi:hypothetical protein
MRWDKFGGLMSLFILIIIGMAACAKLAACLDNYGNCPL